MNKRTTTFLVAACASVGVHAAMFSVFPRYEVGGWAVHWPAGGHTPKTEMKIVLEPAPEMPVEEPPEFETGADKAKGYASHEVPARREATAREAEADQAALSLDPAGAGDRGTEAALRHADGAGSTIGQPGGSPPPAVLESPADPGPASSPPQTDADANLRSPGDVPDPPPELEPVLPAPPAPKEVVIEGGDDEPVNPTTEMPPAPEAKTPVARVEPQSVPVPEASTPAPEPLPTPQAGGTRAGGWASAAADPARMSDSESDPFSRLGTAIVRDGRLQIRFGRKVKTRRPKLLLAAQTDLLTLRRADVVLTIDIDETGKVTSVKVTKSSGSKDIDQPTRVAVYDWWFEPKRDAAGRPVADQVKFTVGWR